MSDEIIDLEALKKKLTPKRIAIGIAVILLIIAVFSSFYVVDQKEEAVIPLVLKRILTFPPKRT